MQPRAGTLLLSAPQITLPLLLRFTGDIHCSTCLKCNRPESSHVALFKTKEESAKLWSQKAYNEFSKTLYFKAGSICRSHLPREKLEHAPLTGVKRVRETDLTEDVSHHPFPQYLKCHFVVEQLPSLYQLQHLHPAPLGLLAFEATVQSSSSQQFLMRYANKTSLLVPPNGNYELSGAFPEATVLLIPLLRIIDLPLSPCQHSAFKPQIQRCLHPGGQGVVRCAALSQERSAAREPGYRRGQQMQTHPLGRTSNRGTLSQHLLPRASISQTGLQHTTRAYISAARQKKTSCKAWNKSV